MECLKRIVEACDYFFKESKKNVSKTNKKVKKVLEIESKSAGLENMEEGDLSGLDDDKNHQGAIVTQKNVAAFKELKLGASHVNNMLDDADKKLEELRAAPETDDPIWAGNGENSQNQDDSLNKSNEDLFMNDTEEGF